MYAWDAALKSKKLGICACIKHAFWTFLVYGFNITLKPETWVKSGI